jgi:hypothetical protein
MFLFETTDRRWPRRLNCWTFGLPDFLFLVFEKVKHYFDDGESDDDDDYRGIPFRRPRLNQFPMFRCC